MKQFLTYSLLFSLLFVGLSSAHPHPNKNKKGLKGRGFNKVKNISWFGPVSAESECQEYDTDDVDIFNSKKKDPSEFCTDVETEHCFCIASGRQVAKKNKNDKPVNYKFVCTPCSIDWDFKQAIKDLKEEKRANDDDSDEDDSDDENITRKEARKERRQERKEERQQERRQERREERQQERRQERRERRQERRNNRAEDFTEDFTA